MEMNYDERALRQIEEELQTHIYPGTEIMADVGSHHFVKSSAASDRVLVPQPSDDPHDPLNWNRWWKFSTISIATAVSFSQGLGPLALAPMFPQLMEAFNCDLEQAVAFTGIAILVLGFSNFIWVPIQTSYGRRPVLIFSTLVCLGSCIWRARAQSYSSFMGACVLNGLGAGPAETAQPAIIADVFFLHERGAYNTLYFAFYFGSLTVGPIIAGPMADRVGWRNFWWFNVAMLGVVLLACIFAFPETKWHRLHPTELVAAANASSSSNKKDDVEGFEKTGEGKDLDIERIDTARILPQKNPLGHAMTAERDPHLGKGTPSKQQWKIWQPNTSGLKSIALDLWVPWKLFAFPIVEFAAFIVSWSASCFLTLNLTQSQVFAVPPYNLSPETIGLFNCAILVGAIIGLSTNGLLSDWVSMVATRRNKGVREPEMRLPAMIPYVIIMIIGNFVNGFGYQYAWNWKIIVIIGYTCAGIQVAALPAIATTYAVDSYKPVAGSIMVAITVNKNVWGYGFSRFITVWTMADGYVAPIMTNMSLTCLWCLSGIVFYFYGKTFRRWSRSSKVHYM